MLRRSSILLGLSLSLTLGTRGAQAVVGHCETNAGNDCLAAIQASGGVVNDIFKDANGLTGQQLPVFGQLFNAWPGCTIANAGNYLDEYQGTESQCPNVPPHNVGGYDFTAAAAYVNALDWKYIQPVRLVNGHAMSQSGACPSWDQSGTWVDENGATSHDGYVPREGLIWDLGGPSNKVAIFAVNDHGPQPCESVEYTVWLTDNPAATDVIDAPTTDGADPNKWNRAVLSKIFTHGWIDQRAANPGDACGDPADPNNTYPVEADSFVTVYGLPCGIAFRYVSVASGNDGKDFADCAYDSFDGEIDAVAGLTEGGAGVCSDSDGDGFVDCSCPGAPSVCDCNDSDPAVHPGAPEACDDPDLNCDGTPGSCAAGTYCYTHVCLDACGTGEFTCPIGAKCQDADAGLKLCVPTDCTTGSCPPGSVCDPASKTCKPACDNVVCPYGQKCQDGKCIDLCQGVQCPSPKTCINGQCKAPCSCFNNDAGCTAPLVCDRGGTDQCVPSACQNKTCGAGEHCDDSGNCVGVCDSVTCPAGQKCDATQGGCVDNCDGVTCPAGATCDPKTGTCTDKSCDTVFCQGGQTCVAGKCVDTDGGVADSGANDSGGGGTSGSDGGAGGPPRGSTAAGDSGGCGCHTAGGESTGSAWLDLIALALTGAGAARRRRRRASRRGRCA